MRKIIRILTSASTAAYNSKFVSDMNITHDYNGNFVYDCGCVDNNLTTIEVVWVVLIGPDFLSDAQLHSNIMSAVTVGERVIGVWAPSASGMSIPPLLDQYASAIVPWDVQKIHDAICVDVSSLSGSDGQPEGSRPIKRHKC